MKSNTLLGRAAIYTVANLGNSAIPFLLLPLLTRVLSPTEYGLVALFSVLVTVFGAFTGLSVHGAVNVRFHDPQVRMARYVGSTVCVLGASTTITLLLLALLSEEVSAWSNLPKAWLFLALLASAAHFVVQLRLVLWQAQGRAAQFGALQILQTLVNLGLSLLLVLGAQMGASGRVGGIIAALAVASAFSAWSLRRNREMSFRPDPAYVADALRFGIPLVPHVLGGVAIANGDRLIVAGLAGLHEAGIYAASMQLGLIVGLGADSVVKALSPWMFANLRSDEPAVRRRIVRVSYLFFVGCAFLATATVLAAPWLLQLVGDEFRNSGEVLTFVAVGGAFSGMYLIVVNYIFFAHRNEWLALITISIGAFNLALAAWLVQQKGAVGAAQAFAASQLLMFLATWYAASRCCSMPWRVGFISLFRKELR